MGKELKNIYYLSSGTAKQEQLLTTPPKNLHLKIQLIKIILTFIYCKIQQLHSNKLSEKLEISLCVYLLWWLGFWTWKFFDFGGEIRDRKLWWSTDDGEMKSVDESWTRVGSLLAVVDGGRSWRLLGCDCLWNGFYIFDGIDKTSMYKQILFHFSIIEPVFFSIKI